MFRYARCPQCTLRLDVATVWATGSCCPGCLAPLEWQSEGRRFQLAPARPAPPGRGAERPRASGRAASDRLSFVARRPQPRNIWSGAPLL